MNVCFNFFSNYAPSFLRERNLSSSIVLQNKTFMIASVALGCIGLAYFGLKCYDFKTKVLKGNFKKIEQANSEKQSLKLEGKKEESEVKKETGQEKLEEKEVKEQKPYIEEILKEELPEDSLTDESKAKKDHLEEAKFEQNLLDYEKAKKEQEQKFNIEHERLEAQLKAAESDPKRLKEINFYMKMLKDAHKENMQTLKLTYQIQSKI